MWVLSPMLPSSSQKAAEEGGIPNPVQFLTSGLITVGRPAKKGGTTGKANILIFGESSVSTLHAEFNIQPASANGEYGCVTVKDSSSKYGTYVKKQQSGAAEERLQADTALQLQLGDIIRFGTKCRYKLQQIPLNICAAGPCASDSALIAAAAACNATLVSTCSSTSCSHCIAAEGGVVTAQVLCALLQQVPLVTSTWLDAVAASKSHAGSLPDAEGFVPKQMLLPLLLPDQQQDHQQQQKVLVLATWQAPPANLLARYTFITSGGCQGDLPAAAKCLGACMEVKAAGQITSESLTAEDKKEASAGKAAVLVIPADTDAAAAGAAAAATTQAVAAISEQQLLHAMATGDAGAITEAVEAFRQQQAAAAQAAAAAAAAANEAAAAAEGSQDLTEVDETDEGEGDDAASHEDLQAVTPVIHGTRKRQQAAGRAAAAKSPAKSPAKTKAPLQLQPAAATPSRTRGSKRGAAAVAEEEPAAAAAAATAAAGQPAQGRKRRKVAAAAAAGHEEEDAVMAESPAAVNAHAAVNPQQQQQQQAISSNAAAAAAPAAAAAGEQLQEGIIAMPLVIANPKPRVLQNAPVNSGVNFKAFRRKQTAGNNQQLAPAAAAAAAAASGFVFELVPDKKVVQGDETDAFLKEEQLRRERLQKADELFNANIRPRAAKPPAAPKAAATKAAGTKAAKGSRTKKG